MEISLIQTDVFYKDKAKNIEWVAEALASCERVGDIVVLPELFSTGYIFESPLDIQALCESYDTSPTISALSRLAAKYGTTIVAGVAEEHKGQFFNSVAVIDGKGLIGKYRKVTQTNIDKQYFSRGDTLFTFEHQGVTFGIAVCFDLWFPELIREYSKLGVEVLLHPANFGGEQSLHISKARAIESSLYIVTCNRIGCDVTTDIVGEYCGKSQICAPSGELLVQFGSEAEIKTVKIAVDPSARKKVIGVDLIAEMSAVSHQLALSK
ncbi:carbon-nitrogen hydrolase family protein [Photobacterium swingsii]|uniref:carbon-nitrogen hydrolase family protein n=1 Tax=Photobacterium swingsii TaxID=680026 RepID=UPI004068C9A1